MDVATTVALSLTLLMTLGIGLLHGYQRTTGLKSIVQG